MRCTARRNESVEFVGGYGVRPWHATGHRFGDALPPIGCHRRVRVETAIRRLLKRFSACQTDGALHWLMLPNLWMAIRRLILGAMKLPTGAAAKPLIDVWLAAFACRALIFMFFVAHAANPHRFRSLVRSGQHVRSIGVEPRQPREEASRSHIVLQRKSQH